MRKKNTLYTVNKWNKGGLLFGKNLFLSGGLTDSTFGNSNHAVDFGYGYQSPTIKQQVMQNINQLQGISFDADKMKKGIDLGVGNVKNLADSSANTMNYKDNRTAVDPSFTQTAGSTQAVTAPKQEGSKPLGITNVVQRVASALPLAQIAGNAGSLFSSAGNAAKTVASTAAKSGIKVGTGAAKTGGEAVLKGTIGSGKAINGGVGAAGAASNAGKFSSALGASKLSSVGKIGVGIAGTAAGMAAKHFFSDGFETDAGNIVGTIGDAAGSIISIFNPVAGAVVDAVVGGAIPGLINRSWGMKTNGQALASAKNTAARNTAISQSDNIFDAAADLSSAYTDPYEGGWFRQGDEEYNNWKIREDVNRSVRDVENALYNKSHDMLRDAYYNSSAYGGPIETMPNNDDMGAINYGFMSDYLTIKGQNNQNKNQITSLFAGTPSTMFDLGGVLQTHGSDWGSGLTHINAGGSHESNPNDGIQMGVDSEGTPNLVEEDETVWNDYVFSNRIFADEEAKSKFHLPKKKDITYAEISKKLEKEIAERPNDAVSRAGFNAQMQTLEEQQERQKAEMEAARAREAFEALSPEEQTAVMQNAAQQEAMAQQAAQEQAMQQPSPEEAAMMQQQMAEQQAIQDQQQLAQMQANVSALGGQLVKASDVDPKANVFAVGGRKARKVARKYSKQWFENQAKSLGISEEDMDKFVFDENDPTANLANFNNIYKEYQRKQALDTYVKGQRQSKKNELFGDKGLYRISDDGKRIYKARTNSAAREGWINADYRGQDELEDNIKSGRFISNEAYSKLSDEEKAKYKRINERAGDKMYDFNGKLLEEIQPEDATIDSILDQFDADYSKDFKWDDKDVQTLQYPVDMEHSNLSYLRYVPALGGAVGLLNDVLTSPDYSRADDVINAGRGLMTPKMVDPHYIGNYLTYRPMDIWYQQNALNAQSRATDRALLNSNSPSRAAGLLANGYNSQLASGNLYRQALEYNDALEKQVEGFNRGTNIFNAQADMNTQQANQNALLQSGRLGLQGIIAGNQMKEDVDARKGASMSANLTNLMQSIGNIGEEAYDEDRLKWLEGTGVLRSDYFNRGKYGTSAAKGGKLKKKRGLTI